MRIGLSIGLLFLLTIPSTFAQEKPKALIQKAVDAMGGIKTLTKINAAVRKVKGQFPDRGEKFSGVTYSSDGKLKLIQSYDGADADKKRILLIKGGRAWITIGTSTFNLDDVMMQRLKLARHADKVSGLVTLLKDEGYTLSSLGETQVKGNAALGVKVEYDEQPDMHLFFDKKTGHLVKTWRRFREPDDNKETVHEMYYLSYQEFDPITEDMKIVRQAKIAPEGPNLLKWLEKRSLSKENKAVIGTLLTQLRSKLYAVRTKATFELKKFGPEAGALLQPLLNDPDDEVVRRVKQCLEHYAEDDSIKIIPSVLRMIAWTRPKGAVPALLEYLPSAPNQGVRDEVQAALYHLAKVTEKPHPALVAALTDADPAKQAAAKAALGKDGGAYAKKPGRRLLIRGRVRSMRSEMYRDGKLHMILETQAIQYYNALEDRLFDLPT